MNPYKHQFAVPESIYLLNHSVGCLPHTAAETHRAHFLAPWQAGGGEAWGAWLDTIDDFCQALATLFNGQPDDFCPQTNVSSALAKILSSLPPPQERPKLLIAHSDFPSIGFATYPMRRLGYEVVTLTPPEDQNVLDYWRAHLTADVRLAVITHVTYNHSWMNPVREIVQLARQNGIITVIDIAQAAGVVPIDLQTWQADFVVGSSVKWLCGGPGAAYLWANPTTLPRFEPLDVGWFSHENPFELDIHHFRYAATAKRFWGGTPSISPFAIANASLRAMSAIGLETIRAHNQRLTQRLLDAAAARGWVALTPRDQRGGTVALTFGEQTAQVYEQLRQRGILVDRRGAGIRFSPHIYNDEEEIARVVAALEGCL